MNQMIAALTSAGVPLPSIKERIWRKIAEAGPNGITNDTLTKQLSKINRNSISSSLNNMLNRNMISTRQGVGSGRFLYTTDMMKYELLDIQHLPQKRVGGSTAPAAAPAAAPADPLVAVKGSFADLYASNYNEVVMAWVQAGGSPYALRDMSLADFLKNAARNGVALTARTAK